MKAAATGAGKGSRKGGGGGSGGGESKISMYSALGQYSADLRQSELRILAEEDAIAHLKTVKKDKQDEYQKLTQKFAELQMKKSSMESEQKRIKALKLSTKNEMDESKATVGEIKERLARKRTCIDKLKAEIVLKEQQFAELFQKRQEYFDSTTRGQKRRKLKQDVTELEKILNVGKLEVEKLTLELQSKRKEQNQNWNEFKKYCVKLAEKICMPKLQKKHGISTTRANSALDILDVTKSSKSKSSWSDFYRSPSSSMVGRKRTSIFSRIPHGLPTAGKISRSEESSGVIHSQKILDEGVFRKLLPSVAKESKEPGASEISQETRNVEKTRKIGATAASQCPQEVVVAESGAPAASHRPLEVLVVDSGSPGPSQRPQEIVDQGILGRPLPSITVSMESETPGSSDTPQETLNVEKTRAPAASQRPKETHVVETGGPVVSERPQDTLVVETVAPAASQRPQEILDEGVFRRPLPPAVAVETGIPGASQRPQELLDEGIFGRPKPSTAAVETDDDLGWMNQPSGDTRFGNSSDAGNDFFSGFTSNMGGGLWSGNGSSNNSLF